MFKPEQEPKENSKEQLTETFGQLIKAQEFFNERVNEVMGGDLDEDMKAENLINLKRQIPDITDKMEIVLEKLRTLE